MSWELASFALLAIALGAGFAWYERGHPSAKVLALVATLAALAALGRLAFAPLPNVKPTTDIVLLSGYVLGGAPGFAVGTIAALASNFFFGQGPYTPFQMAGWGAIGVFGALLPRGLGRYSLAAACGFAGLAYGLWMDFHLWLLYTGHTAGEYGVLAARSIPFNAAHVVGNVVFCALFGPALVRALSRFRDRFEITWHPAPATAAGVLAALILVGAAAETARAQDDRAIERAAAYLASAQAPDGGLGSAPGATESNAMHSAWAAMGLAAAGRHPADVRRGGPSLADYAARSATAARETADLQRAILALRAAQRPSDAVERTLVARQRRDGSFNGLVNQTAFGILALRAAGRSQRDARIRRAARWIERRQNRDGGFGFAGRGSPTSVDDTAAALEALVAAGRRRSATVRRATQHLLRRQGADGGFGLTRNQGSNAQSTAWAVQALVAAGRDPERVRRDGSRSPLAYLRSLQAEDGSIRYSRTSRQTPVWVTGQALAALARKPLPVAAPPRARPSAAVRARAFVAMLSSLFVL